MGLPKKLLNVVISVLYMSFFGILYTILRPLGVRKNEPLKKRARQLNIQAAKNLGGDSVFVKLPNGISLHAFEAGDRNAKLVILLHGFPDCWHSWSGVIPALVKKGYFVVAPDMRGYNLSDKPEGLKNYYMGPLVNDIKELIGFYNKKTAVVVAHDWGGVVAWALADKHPEVLEKLVILNAPHTKAFERETQKKKNMYQILSSWYILWFQIPLLAQNVITYNPYASIKTFFITKKKDALSAEDRDVLASAYVQDGAMPAMINYYKGLVRLQLSKLMSKRKPSERREKPQKVQTPTLIIWGEDDSALVRELAMCSEYVEKVQVLYIPRCSHWVPYEAPEIVAREVIKFIQ